jgi:lysophospholipase L1-like esterase
MALVFALSALVLAPAANASNPPPEVQTVMALGDSISFGYSAEKFNVNFPNDAPSFFEEGGVNVLAKDLHKVPGVSKGLTIINDACPGETSNGLIGENELIGGQKSTESIEEVEAPGGFQGPGDFHPCKYHNVNGLPLHNSLGGASQLEEALSVLKEGHPAHPVKAITLNIGSNDELAAVTKCIDQVGGEFQAEGKSVYGPVFALALIACIKHVVATETVPRIIENLDKTIGAIDSTEPGGGHYAGPIILLGFYNPQSFVLPGSDPGQIETNEAVVANVVKNFPNVTYANPFPVFNKFSGGSAKKEQETICKYTEMCNPNVQAENGSPKGADGDIHPTPLGYKEIGKLMFEAYEANPAK